MRPWVCFGLNSIVVLWASHRYCQSRTAELGNKEECQLAQALWSRPIQVIWIWNVSLHSNEDKNYISHVNWLCPDYSHKRSRTHVGSSVAILVSSSSCACFNQGNLASTGLFSKERRNRNNRLNYCSSLRSWIHDYLLKISPLKRPCFYSAGWVHWHSTFSGFWLEPNISAIYFLN